MVLQLFLVVDSIKETEWDEDLSILAEEEASIGVADTPSVVVDADWSCFSFCRRIPIREEREKGWRTRPVDHFTENGGNPATMPQDKTLFDGLEVLVAIILAFLNFQISPRLWKRDCLLYTSPSPRDQRGSRMPSSA